MIRSVRQDFDVEFLPVISRLCKLADIELVSASRMETSFMVGTTDFYIPWHLLDVDEREKILTDLEYYRIFESAAKKLNNERFVKMPCKCT